MSASSCISSISVLERGRCCLKAYIIGQSGAHRNPALISQLEKQFVIVTDDGYRSPDMTNNSDAANAVLRSIGTSLSPGEIGCALAHKSARDWLLSSNEPYLAIFEDDANATGESLEAVSLAVSQLSGAWQLNLGLLPQDRLVTHLLQRRKTVHRSLIQPSGTFAYVLSREAARLCGEDFTSVDELLEGVADASPAAAGLIKFYVSRPSIFEPLTGAPSAISSSSAGYKRSHPIPPYRGLGNLISVLTSSEIPMHKKRGVLLLRLKFFKHLLSLDAFSMVLKRFGRKLRS